MVVITQGKISYYMDGYLSKQLSSKIHKNIHKKDKDYVVIVDGAEGSGKSVFAQQLAITLDPSFNLNRMAMDSTEFTKCIIKAQKGQCVVFDEAFTGLSSRGALTEINKLLVSLMMEMRQKNLFVIIVMPTFFELERYVALYRARGLFHVYEKSNKRGYWVYFNRIKKKFLYLKGKKLYDYNVVKASFNGRFYDQYTINEKEYRQKKAEALSKKSRSTRLQKVLTQRNMLIYYLSVQYKLSTIKISKILNMYGMGVSHQLISEIVRNVKKQEKERKLLETSTTRQQNKDKI